MKTKSLISHAASILVIIALVLLVAWSCATAYGNVGFEWDPNQEEGVEYRLYGINMEAPWDPDRSDFLKIDVGDVTSARVEGLKPGHWWFSLKAVLGGVESEFSNVVSFVVPEAPEGFRLVLETSVNLKDWNDAGFFRVRIKRQE